MNKLSVSFTALIYIVFPVCLLIPFAMSAQIIWQKSYGGTATEAPSAIKSTTDGGYIISGYSDSDDHDLTKNNGGYDFWIIKVDSTGKLQWQKSYGGSSYDQSRDMTTTRDGGYIITGEVYSNDGDIKGANGKYDCWVIKLDSAGNLLWQNALGGSDDDEGIAINQLASGYYIMAGASSSLDKDVTGHHGSKGVYDCWIAILDSTGKLQWEQSFGGSQADLAYSVEQTKDGGYIIGGMTQSTDGDVIGNHGYYDAWILKLDLQGKIQWSKALGGSSIDYCSKIYQTPDGGYIGCGGANSNDGQVTGHHGDTNQSDVWVFKLDSAGNLLWEKSYGGSQYDWANNLAPTKDNGYILGCTSYSTDGDVTDHHGDTNDADIWLVKINASGNLQWTKSLGGTKDDRIRDLLVNKDGTYQLATSAQSTDGDVTTTIWGSTDIWLVKYKGPNTGIPEISREKKSGLISSVSPNPAQNKILVTFNLRKAGQTKLTITDLTGQLLESVQLNDIQPGAKQYQFDVSSLQAGMYIVNLWVNDIKSDEAKMVIYQ